MDPGNRSKNVKRFLVNPYYNHTSITYIFDIILYVYMKSFIIVILTSVWLTGILAPPILQLLDVTKPFITINLNEEEPQEQGKKDLSEEVILSNLPRQQSIIFLGSLTRDNWEYNLHYLSYTTEIQLPPPETNQ